MSIINDALKKTQQSFGWKKKKDKGKQESPEPTKPKTDETVNVYEKLYNQRQEQAAASATETKKSSKGGTGGGFKAVFRAIVSWLILAGILFFGYKFLSTYEPFQNLVRDIKGETKSSRAEIAKYMPTKKRVYKDGDLVLNGISEIDGQKVALINDEIYQVGEVVNNKTIVSITKDEVQLEDGEDIYTITVR